VAGVAAVQAKLLRDAGHDVDQIPLSQAGATWAWPAKALAIPYRLAAYLPTINRIRRGRYDVVHIHWLSHGIAGVLSGQPFFAQAHGSDLHLNMRNPVYRLVTRTVLKNAKRVFYVTPNLREYLAGFEPKLIYLPNPVDVDGLAPKAFPTEPKRALIFTRLDAIKGVDRIFPAVERLSQVVEVTALDWGPLAASYRQSYSRWVRFVPPVAHADVGAFLQQFDVVIGQMRQGILSLSEIEALAAGRPVITGIDPTLYQEGAPPVMAAHSPEGIIQAIEQLRADPDMFSRLAHAGPDWARRNHGYARHLELLEASYFT
jgi:glycosyltransferase involved in cell wall biosynthesis